MNHRLSILFLSVALAAPCRAAPPASLPEPLPFRVDFRTVVLSLAERPGRAQVTQFLALRPLTGGDAHLFLPTAGNPEAIEAQAMTQAEFDRSCTHGPQLEPTFYAAAQAERRAHLCLFSALGANGGAPVWALLGVRWPPRAPAITAVIPPPAASASPLPTIRDLRLLRANDPPARGQPPADKSAQATLRRSPDGTVIDVVIRLPASSADERTRAAVSGIRVRYEIPLPGPTGRVAAPLAVDPRVEPPALTRLYAVVPATRRAQATAPIQAGRAQPQALVNQALDAFGWSDAYRQSCARERGGAAMTALRASDGAVVTRWVAAFRPVEGELRLELNGSALRADDRARQAVGRALLVLVWPLAGGLYLLGITQAPRLHRWLTGLRPTPNGRRRMALLIFLSPLLTPWFVMRYNSHADGSIPEVEEDGALGTLSLQAYECLARVVIWAILICVSWVLVGLTAMLGLWLRFG